ncbi:iap-like protein [Trichoplusia ni ascovirus 6b]|nr:iap-like protein [Trichoplusia ni ascovirus 6b]
MGNYIFTTSVIDDFEQLFNIIMAENRDRENDHIETYLVKVSSDSISYGTSTKKTLCEVFINTIIETILIRYNEDGYEYTVTNDVVQSFLDNNYEYVVSDVCIICESGRSSCITLPCAHRCLCNYCLKSITTKTCPLCRNEIKLVIGFIY